ncbi:DUF2231 domain-containing protein [Sulfurimonas sp. C5]|uniref:DUF2231 domain-containing protein n=1 Tax=Sulfurimonas sp. C5 TaxID=3036947 RepID=UPI002456A0E5|nr:DUF2231 domain-containing protein [Sulfurimonas sp. C5]MDH4944271.1 hypothetical protein [Sulfurimonas sp. C5]
MMLHPASAHFGMVLPVVAAVFGLAYLVSRSETMSKISARTAVVAALAMIGVWYTGSQAGPQIYNFLSEAGKHELLEHKELGLYLAIAMTIVALIQFAGCKLQKFGLQALGVILTVVVMAVTFIQGKHGGEIVYEHGKPFQMTQLEKYLTGDDFGFIEDMDEAKTAINEKISSIGEETCAKIGCEEEAKENEEE